MWNHTDSEAVVSVHCTLLYCLSTDTTGSTFRYNQYRLENWSSRSTTVTGTIGKEYILYSTEKCKLYREQ